MRAEKGTPSYEFTERRLLEKAFAKGILQGKFSNWNWLGRKNCIVQKLERNSIFHKGQKKKYHTLVVAAGIFLSCGGDAIFIDVMVERGTEDVVIIP